MRGSAPSCPRLADKSLMETTIDAFLGGLLDIEQPKKGHHRAGLDAVFLGAFADPPQSAIVIDMGAGVGTAGLCLAARRPDIHLVLAEREAELSKLAAGNIERNFAGTAGNKFNAVTVDLLGPSENLDTKGLTANVADMVLLNPPFYRASETRTSPSPKRAAAHVLDEDGLLPWVKRAAHLLKANGELVLIFRASGLADCLNALKGRFGGGAVLPLHPRLDEPATKILIRMTKGRNGPPDLLSGFVLHRDKSGAFSDAAEAVLRHGQGLDS